MKKWVNYVDFWAKYTILILKNNNGALFFSFFGEKSVKKRGTTQ